MDLNRLRTAAEASATPLVRTAFDDEEAWRFVVAQVSKPVDFEDPTNEDPGADGYAPNIVAIDENDFAGVTGATLGTAVAAAGQPHGYVLLADSRSMVEAVAGGEVTVDYVDLSVTDPEDAELFQSYLGRTFRVAVPEIASIEANLSIANMDFHEFADNVDADGVFRGFPNDD